MSTSKKKKEEAFGGQHAARKVRGGDSITVAVVKPPPSRYSITICISREDLDAVLMDLSVGDTSVASTRLYDLMRNLCE
jgi:hypothetical protein